MVNEVLEKKHEEELSVGHYTFKKIRETVITFGGLIGGTYIGGLLGGMYAKSKNLPHEMSSLAESIPFLNGKGINKQQGNGGFIGFMLGSLISGMIIGYEHWRKVESQKLAVDEINQDIANTIAIQPIDKELVVENKRLRGMLDEIENKRASRDAILAQGPKSHVEHAAHHHAAHSKA